MREFESKRLVRDQIVPNIIAEGSQASFRVLEDQEYL